MSMGSDNTLPDWMSRELEKRGWSQRELGRRTGIAFQSISRYASGERTPDPKTCRRIAKAFEVPYEDIMRLAGHLPLTRPGEIHITDEQLAAINAVRRAEGRGAVERIDLTPFIGANLGEEIEGFLREFPALRPIMEFAKAYHLGEEYIQAIIYNVRVYLADPVAREAFVSAHGLLQEAFQQGLNEPEGKAEE